MQLKKWTTFSFGTLAALALLGTSAGAQEAKTTSLDAAIQQALNETSHMFMRQVGTPFEGVERAWQAPNKDRDLRTYLLSDGVRVLPRSDADAWRWGLELERFGRAGSMIEMSDGELRVEGARAEYVREQIVEWYVNDHRGLEQGFDIPVRPDGEGELELVFDVEGEFDLRIAESGRDIVFTEADGQDAVSYANLTAFDADGEQLPTRFEKRDSGFAIVVDDTGAAYPITVDPLINNLQAELVPTGAPAGNRLGMSVDIDGDRAVVGAAQADQTGLAYAFEKVGAFWQIDAKLTLGSTAEVGDMFGQDVAILENHIVVGAPLRDFAAQNSGAVFYYIRNVQDEWVLVQGFTNATTNFGDKYGFSVDMGIDQTGFNKFLIVGAPSREVNGNNLQGAAYTYTLVGQWTPTGFLSNPNGEFADNYGISVSIDGGVAAVGAFFADGTLNNIGSVHVWRQDGLTFKSDEFISSPNPQSGGAFGRSVDVSDNRIIVGANGEGRAHIYVDNGVNWVHEEELSTTGGFSSFGVSVDIESDDDVHTAIVGALGTEAAFVYEGKDGNWAEVAKLEIQNSDGLDDFGSSVALQGNLALVGAPGRDLGDEDTGAVFSYERIGSNWQPIQVITGNNWDAEDNLGFSTSIDGDTAIVGATGDSDAAFRGGAAYIFERNGTQWAMQAKLTAGEDVQKGARFGHSVDVSGDAAVVGASSEDLASFNEGAAYVFERQGSDWSLVERLVASDAGQEDFYGTAVAIQGDDIVVGSPGDDDKAQDAGAAYAYTRVAGDWNFLQKLEGFDANAKSDFGMSADIDGELMVIGAPDHFVNGVRSGSAYTFVRNASNWSTSTRISPFGIGEDDDEFGASVSLSGERVVIGAPFDDTATVNAGAAYIYDKVSILWFLDEKLTASDAGPSAHFGTGVAMDGALVVVGSKNESNVAPAAGAVYAYHQTPEGWEELGKLEDPTLGNNSALGRSVSLSHRTLITGADQADEIGDNSGKAYALLLPGLAPEVYCTPKVNSCGSLPLIEAEGTASASEGSGFLVLATNTRAAKFGVLLYNTGRAAIPFQGGLLCVDPGGLNRTVSVKDINGTPGQCNGVLAIDMNAFASGALGGNPSPVLTTPGTRINVQFWGRDIPGRSLLSNGLEYVVGN